MSAQTALQRYRSASRFWQWMVNEGEIEKSPMSRMSPPHVPEKLVEVVSEDDLRKLFKAVSGTDFESRRDRAILSIFIDLGPRIAEVANLQLADVDQEERELRIVAKGRRERILRYTTETRTDLRRYLRQRAKHRHADAPALWLGRHGPLTGSGIYRMIRRRCDEAGIDPIHPHQLRHTFAHLYLSGGGSEGGLMQTTGWKSRAMVDRYGASVAAARARDAHDRYSPRKAI